MRSVLKACVVLVLTIATPASAVESWVLYDSFNTRFIDATLWRGFELEDTASGGATSDNAREVIFGQLRMMNRGFGGTGSNSSGTFHRQTMAFAKNAELITAMRLTARVLEIDAEGTCPANSFQSVAQGRLRMQGYFFNAGSEDPTNPESLKDNVSAFMAIRRRSTSSDPSDVLQVVATVFQCTDANCDNTNDLFGASLGTVLRGQAVRLSMQWDPDNNQFIFQRDNNAPVFYQYTLPDSGPPSQVIKRIQVTIDLPNCTTGPRPMAFMHLLIDNVYVNAAAAP